MKLSLVFAILLLSTAMAVEYDTVYVNDDGDDTGCPGYDFSTISEALDSVDSSDAKIIVCDGTYENVFIDENGAENLVIMGETGRNPVIIKGSSDRPVFSFFDSSDITLSSLMIKEGEDGIEFYGTDSIVLEDLSVSDQTGGMASGIEVVSSPDVTFKGYISVENVTGTQNVYGIVLSNVDEVNIETDNLKVSYVGSNGDEVVGMSFSGCEEVLIDSPVTIREIDNTNFHSTGLRINECNDVDFKGSLLNVSSVFADATATGVRISDSSFESIGLVEVGFVYTNGAYVHGFFVSGSFIHFQDEVAINSIVTEDAGKSAYGFYVHDDTQAVFDKGPSFLVLMGDESYGFYIMNSVAQIVGPEDGGLSSSKHFSFYVMGDSIVDIENFEDAPGIHTCLALQGTNDGRPSVHLNDSRLDSCENSYNVTNADLYLSDTLIDWYKSYTQKGGQSSVRYRYTVPFKFTDDKGSSLNPTAATFISGAGLQETKTSLNSEEEVSLLYQEVDVDGQEKETVPHHSYTVVISLDGHNQNITDLSLDYGLDEQILSLEPHPVNILGLKLKKGENLIKDYIFQAREKECTEQPPGEGFKCYDIELPYEISLDPEEVHYTLINFTVPEDWRTENNVPADEIRLYHYDNGWEELDTVLSNGVYQANTTALSEFAVAGEPEACLSDSDCVEPYTCVDSVCECTLECTGDEVLDEQTCECVVPSEEPDDGNGDGGSPGGTPVTPPSENETEPVNETVNDSVDPGNVSEPVDENETLPPEPQENETISNTSEGCTVECPEGTYLDQQRCVCVEPAKGGDITQALILIGGLIVLVLIAIGAYFYSKKAGNKKPEKKQKSK